MTRSIDDGPIRWRRALRLIGALRFTRGWLDWAMLAAFVGCLVLIGLPALSGDRADRHMAGVGAIWFVLLVYGLHVATGLFNRGWRILPVSARDRRAAAWLMVAVLPLVFDLAATLIGVGVAALRGHHGAVTSGIVLFGTRGLAMECYALLAVCFGNWPATATYLWNVSHRQPRDWLMGLLMLPIAIGMLVGNDAIMAVPAVGWLSTALALGLCAVLLPVTLRMIRLDHQPRDTGLFEGLTETTERLLGLRLSGWSGHFVRQAVRTLGIWALIAGLEIAAQRLLPVSGANGPHEALFREGFREGLSFGTASTPWVVPAMAGALIATMTQQYLLRARLLLLSLPRGDRLTLMTPACNALLVFVATLALVWPSVVAEPGWGLKLVVSALYGMAMLYLALACNLGATGYARQMTTGLLIGMAGAGVGAFGALSAHAPHRLDGLLVPIGAVSLVVLIAALVWCRWQLRHSRAPYRAWPGTSGTWRAA